MENKEKIIVKILENKETKDVTQRCIENKETKDATQRY